jgi:hypothetical protein
MLRALRSGRCSEQAQREQGTVHDMTATREGREERALTRSSPNKPLQRAGTDKVLGRGRLSVVFDSSLPRPRADASAAGR